MNTYYLRCIESDYLQLIALGKMMGVIQQAGNVISTTDPAGCWDYIGTIYRDGQPLTDPGGNTYIHVNLMTTVNLREAATALAASKPEIAAGLANLPKYFLVDAEGNAAAPALPHRVFAT